MWKSRNKTDLIIEVWEKLDCETVGATEIEAIETAVAAVYGPSAVDSPMIIARLLADEGAELRHSEVMDLYVRRASAKPYEAALQKVLDTTSLKTALRSLRNIENLRTKYSRENDTEGLRLLRREVIEEKEKMLGRAAKRNLDPGKRLEAGEIAQWLTLWLQSPEVFENWLKLRRQSPDFLAKFGEI